MPSPVLPKTQKKAPGSPQQVVYKLAELFCGPGGIGLAAKGVEHQRNGKSFKISPVWANDIDADTCRTYAHNIHGIGFNEELPKHVVAGPIQEVPDLSKQSIPEFNALAFGFPCNDFSIVGEKRGLNGQFGPLYTHGVRALNAQAPDWFIAENVGGLVNQNEGKTFNLILNDLVNAGPGYVVTPHLYRFEEYGVPQSRHRVVIVGLRKDLNKKFAVPIPTHHSLEDFVSVEEILRQDISPSASHNTLTRQSERVTERLQLIAPGKNAWWLDELLQLSDSDLVDSVRRLRPQFQKYFGFSPKNVKKLRAKIKEVKLNVKSARMSHIYKRLDPQKPCYTITGSGGGGTHVYHWDEPRALTNRERARIQGFPDDFSFYGSSESARKQIGMAVPVSGAKAILRAILKTMAEEPYTSVPQDIAFSND